ncbi:MAG: radical SAM family heme chaperone HemW [Planctomycetes bacterium]|nr:radical SAM family heme chaperone HemW [Planctomycetota bacterium]
MPPSTQLTRFGKAVQGSSCPTTIADLDVLGELSDGTAAPQGIYGHVPFCFHKCHYCDFYSLVDRRDRQPMFVQRLTEELRLAGPYFKRPLRTIFFGGGTPTLLAAEHWRTVLDAVRDNLSLESGYEFTLEANPETVHAELLAVLVDGGVNRLSLGAQSFQPKQLEALERWHDPANVERSVKLAQAAGIWNINLDLIFAIPGQSLNAWLADLDTAVALEPTHLSCYNLTYESNTPMTAKMRSGAIRPVENEVEAQMYEATIERLAEAGFEHYEISNWARPGYRCRHNMMYWENENWWPLGPSAAGHIAGTRWRNVPRLDAYLAQGSWPPICDVEQLDADGRVGEELMLRLRLIDGVALDRLDELLAVGQRGPQRMAAIAQHIDGGLLQRTSDRLKLTKRGLLLADLVLADLL